MAGCGWNLKPRQEYSVELLTDHLIDFLDRRGIDRCTLVGHSLGGMVCLGATLRQPWRVKSLGLVGAAGVAPLPKWMKMGGKFFLKEEILFKTLCIGAEFILKNVFIDSADDNPNVKAFCESAMRDRPGYPNLKDFARVCESLCKDVVRRDYSDRLHELDIPVVGIWGDGDKLTPIPTILQNLGKISNVRSVIIKGCGHMPMVEKPMETLYHLQRFLQKPPAF
jgi:pimeloyl-ACP methyl ester carboxylesterase